MSPRMRSVSTSRVVDRPERSAASTSARLAVSTCPITSASPRRAANPSKKDEICSSLTAPSASNAVRARAVASAAMAYWAAGTCSRSPVSPRAIKRSPAANASASSSADGDVAVAADDHDLAGDEAFQGEGLGHGASVG